MKKSYMYILVVVLIILGVGGGTYYYLSSKNQKPEESYSNKPKEETLTEKELEEYLSYIPGGDYNYNPIYYNGTKPEGGYTYNGVSNIENIDKYILISNVLSKNNMIDNFDNNKEIATNPNLMCSEKTSTNDYYDLDKINAKLKTMYNYELTDLENTTKKEEIVAIAGGMGYYYNEGRFISSNCGGGGGDNRNIIHLIDDYETNKDELIIYEHAANYAGYENEFIIFDYLNNTELNSNGTLNVHEMFKENKDKFSKYKHTFKKNNNEYYWYSTEVI